MKVLFLILIFPFMSLIAQTSTNPDPVRKEAANAMAGKNWQTAVSLYKKILNAEPQNFGDWTSLATAYYNLNQFQESAAAYEKSLTIQSSPVVMYNLACSYARAGSIAKAWPWFEKAALSGRFTSGQIRTDPDLTSLYSARFDSLMAKVDRINCPCEYDSMARQFDFWIGDWDVFTQQGQKTGTNLIQRTENGCLLLENWNGALGGTGKSMNFFDTNLKMWREIWVDNRGSSSEYTGQYRDSVMDFRGEMTMPDQRKVKKRLRFFFMTPDKVRQFAEQSYDDGKTWQTTYDFIYIRKSK